MRLLAIRWFVMHDALIRPVPRPRPVVLGNFRRRELYIWLLAGLFGNILVYLVDPSSLATTFLSVASLNLILCFSMFVILNRLFRSDAAVLANRADAPLAILVGSMLLGSALLGVRWGIGLPATVMAAVMLSVHRGSSDMRCAGAVLMALSVQLFWAPMLFQLLYPEFLSADAAVVGAFLTLTNPDIIIVENTMFSTNGHAVTLSGACSSFNNLSLAMLGCVSMIMFFRDRWQASDIHWVVFICILMIAMNAARLGVLALDYETYQYWHNEAGATIIGVAESLVIFAASLAAAHHGKRDH